MLLRLYEVTERQFNFFAKNYFLYKENWTSVSKQLRSSSGFFSSEVNCLTNPFSQKNAIELFTLVLTNINRILQYTCLIFLAQETNFREKIELSFCYVIEPQKHEMLDFTSVPK